MRHSVISRRQTRPFLCCYWAEMLLFAPQYLPYKSNMNVNQVVFFIHPLHQELAFHTKSFWRSDSGSSSRSAPLRTSLKGGHTSPLCSDSTQRPALCKVFVCQCWRWWGGNHLDAVGADTCLSISFFLSLRLPFIRCTLCRWSSETGWIKPGNDHSSARPSPF